MSGDMMYEIRRFNYDVGRGTYQVVKIGAGKCVSERVVPPAGDAYSFNIDRWSRTVELYVSPTGRSVRVYVDGIEVDQ